MSPPLKNSFCENSQSSYMQHLNGTQERTTMMSFLFLLTEEKEHVNAKNLKQAEFPACTKN